MGEIEKLMGVLKISESATRKLLKPMIFRCKTCNFQHPPDKKAQLDAEEVFISADSEDGKEVVEKWLNVIGATDYATLMT